MKSKPSRSIAERNRLVEENLAFVHWKVRRLRIKSQAIARMEYEDAVQAGMLGMIRAAELHDQTKGSIRTIAGWHILSYLQRALPHSTTVKIPAHCYTCGSVISHRDGAPKKTLNAAQFAEDGQEQSEWLLWEDGDIERMQTAEQVNAWINRLPPQQAEIIHLYYFEERTIKEASCIDAQAKLVVNEEEAKRVREIFDLYLQGRGLLPVVEELRQRGWMNKRWTTRKGKERGGKQQFPA